MDHYIHTLESCTLNFAFSAISGKWKPYILWYLHSAPGGVCRYGELKRLVPYDISHKIFTQQLQELESYNIIKRTEYDEKPKRVEYSLTEPGKLLLPVILYMRDWGILASKDCQPGAIERTHGQPQGSTIHYGYRSEELDKSVSIAFQWGEPVQPVTDDGGAAQTQERSDEEKNKTGSPEGDPAETVGKPSGFPAKRRAACGRHTLYGFFTSSRG